MDHFEKIAARLESRDLDAMLLTNEANRFSHPVTPRRRPPRRHSRPARGAGGGVLI